MIIMVVTCKFNIVYANNYLNAQGMFTQKQPLLNLQSDDFEVWSDGAEVTTKYAEQYLEVTVDATNKVEQDYYTIYIYRTGRFDWSDYGEIAFYLNNMSDESMKLNFAITDTDGTEYILTEMMPEIGRAHV